MGDWILGENSKGNQNEHIEVNRLLKKYNEKTRGEVCKGVAPRPLRDSPPEAAIIFPDP